MNNDQRHTQLNEARALALSWAVTAEDAQSEGSTFTAQYIAMAYMWAQVANAFKVGNPNADAV